MTKPIPALSLLIGVLFSPSAPAQEPRPVDTSTFLPQLRAGLAEVKAAYDNARVKGTFEVDHARGNGDKKARFLLDFLRQGRNLKLTSAEEVGQRAGVEDLSVWTPQIAFVAVRRSPDQVGRSLKALVRSPEAETSKGTTQAEAAKGAQTPSDGERMYNSMLNQVRFLRAPFSYLDVDLDVFLSDKDVTIREVTTEPAGDGKRTKVVFDTKGSAEAATFYMEGRFLLDPLRHYVLHSGYVKRHSIEEGKDYPYEVSLEVQYDKEVRGVPVLSHVRYEGKNYDGVVDAVYDTKVASVEFDPPVSADEFTLKGNGIDFEPGVEATTGRRLPRLFYWSTAATIVLIVLMAVLRRHRASLVENRPAA